MDSQTSIDSAPHVSQRLSYIGIAISLPWIANTVRVLKAVDREKQPVAVEEETSLPQPTCRHPVNPQSNSTLERTSDGHVVYRRP